MKKAIHIVFLLLTLLVMGIIFFFSSQNRDASASTSGNVTRFILSLFISGFQKMDESTQLQLVEQYGHLVRKLAHFSEFAALGFCLEGFFFSSKGLQWKGSVIASLCSGFLYACSDEFHQLFVSYRGPSFRDVMIDFSGVVAGTLLVVIFMMVLTYLKKNPAKSR